MIETLRIPDNRKPVLIGKNGETKKHVEKKTRTEIAVGDEISISGELPDVLKSVDIVKAIGRGFSPRIALGMLSEDCTLDIISIKGTENTIKRLMARVIGKSGKARKNIENLTGAHISVYGKTISIIGKSDEVGPARRLIEMLLSGRMHSYVYRRLERSKDAKKSRRAGKGTQGSKHI